MSCIFYGEEVAVTTFQVNLAANGGRLADGRLMSDLTVVKGSESRFAIKRYPTIQLGTPGYYRKDEESLVWDLKECAVADEPRVEERRNDPADLERQRGNDIGDAHARPLRRAMGQVAYKSVFVREKVQTSYLYGDNCLIFCAAIEPRDDDEWASLQSSLKPTCSHRSTTWTTPSSVGTSLRRSERAAGGRSWWTIAK